MGTCVILYNKGKILQMEFKATLTLWFLIGEEQ